MPVKKSGCRPAELVTLRVFCFLVCSLSGNFSSQEAFQTGGSLSGGCIFLTYSRILTSRSTIAFFLPSVFCSPDLPSIGPQELSPFRSIQWRSPDRMAVLQLSSGSTIRSRPPLRAYILDRPASYRPSKTSHTGAARSTEYL